MSIEDVWIPLVVGGVVLVWFMWTVIAISRVYYSLKGQLGEARRELLSIERAAVAEKFDDIDKFFRANPTFEHAWHEFDEALVKDYGPAPPDGSRPVLLHVSNTLAAHEFFSHEEIVDHRLGTEYNRHLPGVFTAIGILGTFLGIGLGLISAHQSFASLGQPKVSRANLPVSAPVFIPDLAKTQELRDKPPSRSTERLEAWAQHARQTSLDPTRTSFTLIKHESPAVDIDPFDVVNQATQGLIGHIGPAFGASFLAVFFAVLLILIERSIFRKLEQHLLNLQVAVDRVFPRLTQHTLLRALISRADSQEAALKNLSEDFATKLEDKLPAVFSTALGSQTELLRTSFQESTSQMSSVLAAAFQPLTEQMNQTLVEMKKDQASSSQDTLQRMADSFQDSLSNSAGGQLQDMARAISGTSELLEKQKDALEHFVDKIGESMAKQISTLTDQMLRQQAEADTRQRESNENFASFTQQLTATFAGLKDETVSSSSAMLQGVSQQVTSLLQNTFHDQKLANQALMKALEESNERLATSLHQLTRGLEAMSHRIATSTDSLVARLSESTGATIAQLSNTVQGATESTVREVNNTATAAVSKIAEQTAKLFDAAEIQNQRLTQKFEEMTVQFERSSNNNSSKAAETTKALEEALAVALKLSFDVTTMTQSVQAQIAALGQVAINARESAAEFKVISTGLTQQQARSEATLKTMKAVEHAVELQSGVTKVQGESITVVLRGLAEASQTLSSTSEEQRKTLREVAASSDRNLREFGDGVNATVKNLAGATQSYFRQIDEALSKATSHLAATVHELREPLDDLVEMMSTKTR